MKLRKSKSDRYFRIDYQVQSSKVVKFKNNIGGFELRDWTLGPALTGHAVAHSRGAALRGFFWGRDKNNIIINRCVDEGLL